MFHAQVIHTVFKGYQQAKFIVFKGCGEILRSYPLAYNYYNIYIYNVINIIDNKLTERR